MLGGLSAGAAQAQAYTGKFTLPFTVRWGGAVLPAGGYSLAMDSITGPFCPVWGRRFVYKPITRAERDRLANLEQAEKVPVRMASR